jgi:L-rhamnose-H+ transport protein
VKIASLLGVLLYMCGGLGGSAFYLPLKGVRKWSWESYWFIYAVTGLVIAPLVMAALTVPSFLAVLRAAPPHILLWCFIFGATWGVGGLTWGIMIRYLGVGLGMTIGCGLCAAVGTLVPPIYQGQFADLYTTSAGIVTLLGVLVCILGIVVVGMAGMSKENELSDEQKKSSVAEYSFAKGLVVAIISGVMSAGMFLGIRTGDAIVKIATENGLVPKDSPWAGYPGLVVILLGGFTINAGYCLILNVKNRTGGDYARRDASLAPNYLLCALAGVLWYSQFGFLAIGDTKIGSLRFSGPSVLMSTMILFSTVWGILLKEWAGTSRRTKALLAGGLATLIVALVLFGCGNYLKSQSPVSPETEIASHR